MSAWTQRVEVNNFDGIWTWDQQAPSAATYSVTMTQTYSGVQDMMSGIIAFKGAAFQFIQGAGVGSPANVDVDSFTISFTAPNTAGNAIVVDVFMLNDNPDTFGVTDSQGNTYSKVFERFTGAFFGGNVWACFVATGIAAGANTVTVKALPPANPTDIIDWIVAIHEYRGFAASPVDTFDANVTLAQTDVSTINASVTTSGTNELLHAFVVTHQFNAGTMTISTKDFPGQVTGTFTSCFSAGKTGGGTK